MQKKKNIPGEQLSPEQQVKVQLEQTLGELLVAMHRVEFIAYSTLSKDDYQSLLVNVAEFSKQIVEPKQKKDK